MPPIAEKGGGGWTCGRHHHRERLRNDRVLRAPQDGHVRRGVHFHQLPCVRRRQRQQLAPRASRWRRGGAKQIALAPREGQALEERSSSSRLAGWPRTRDKQLPCVRRRQRQRLAPRASRWRRGAALAPREGQAQGGGPGKVGGDLAHQGRHECAITRGVQQPCVTTTTTAATPARGAESKRAHRTCTRIRQGPGPCRPRSEGGRAAQHARLQERTLCVTVTTAAYVDATRRRR